MPSAKPDAKEINALRVKRGYSYPYHSPLYEELHVQCESATKEGYTTPERAAILLEYLQTNPHVASIYPNNILTRLLQEGCKEGKWSPEIEHDILYLIHSLYLEYGKCNNSTLGVGIGVENGILRIEQSNRPRPPTGLSFILADFKPLSAKLRTALASEWLDTVTTKPDIKEKFVGFTGKFEFGSRANCFTEARRRGAVPCNPYPYMDYLFISSEFEKYGVVSSKIDVSIYSRRLYGSPLILREQDWNSIVGDGIAAG